MPPVLRWRITGNGVAGGRGNVVSLDVGLQHLSGGEPLDTHGQRGLHDLYPGGGYFARHAIVELRYYFLLEQTEQMLHVPLLGVGLGTRQGNRPAILPREPLGPPAIERAQLWNAVERRLHAAGTAGMKAALNGVPQLSTLDGWWAEGFTGENGWAIPLSGAEADAEQWDMEHLFRLLEQEVVPKFYDRMPGKVSAAWVQIMKSALAVSVERFTTRQMLQTYVKRYYVPAAAGDAVPGDPPS